MAADFGFIAHAAQRNAHKFAPHGTGDRTPQRSLAHPGRPHKAQNCTFAVVADGVVGHSGFQFFFALKAQFAHSEVFQNAVFDVFQPVVVFIQHFFGVLKV